MSESPRGEATLKLLLIGEEHVRPKVARHYQLLEEGAGIETHFFVDDRSGITSRLQTHGPPLRIEQAPVPRRTLPGILRYWIAFVRCLERVRPQVLEVYTAIHFALLYPMVLYARARGVRVVVVCRGELYPEYFYTETGRIGRWCMVHILRAADLIIYKERWMLPILERFAPKVRRFEWFNAVPIGPKPGVEREGNVVLFLNFFKRFRNVDVAVRAAARVREQIPDVRFLLVGGTSELAEKGQFYADLLAHERELLAMVEELGLRGTVEILPFTNQVDAFYSAAKVYLLPADVVFCNFGLLEAMERGVPPVVTGEKDPDAQRIVEDGVSGRVVNIDPGEVAEAVIGMLQDEDSRREMARAAREKIVRDFNLGTLIGSLGQQYQQLVRPGGVPRPRRASLNAAVGDSASSAT
jgi:glycosyltransferase involved in cell wall biosynthesis